MQRLRYLLSEPLRKNWPTPGSDIPWTHIFLVFPLSQGSSWGRFHIPSTVIFSPISTHRLKWWCQYPGLCLRDLTSIWALISSHREGKLRSSSSDIFPNLCPRQVSLYFPQSLGFKIHISKLFLKFPRCIPSLRQWMKNGLDQWFSKCGPQDGSVPWGCVTNAGSQASSHLHWIRSPGDGTQQPVFW